MLDRLIAFLLDLWHELVPFQVVNQYERGVRLRLGNFHAVVGPGLVWKIPFADKVLTNYVAWTTLNLPPQSLVTRDDKNIVVSAVVKYRVSDIKVFTLEVWDSVDAISDTIQGVVKKVVMSKDWQQCKGEDLDDVLTRKVRAETRKWGIEVSAITLANLAAIRSIRLFNDSTTIS